MKNLFLLTSVVCGGLFLCSCKKDSPVVVQVGNEKITEAKLNERLAATPAEYQKYASTAIGKKQFIDAILKETVIVEAAKKAGVEKREDYRNALSSFETEQKRQLLDYKNGLLIESYIKEIHESIEPNDEEIKKYYNDHKDLFEQPIAYTVRHILVADLQSAQNALERLNNGESFAKVAKEVSQDSGSAANGGLIGPFKKGDLVPEFEEAVVNLKTNEMSGIVETPYGYHIVFKVSEQKLPTISFEQAKETIRKLLEREKFNNWFSKQKENLNVKVNYELPLASTEEEKSK
jgi:parvulin-like peptidyl-prolyl isomerase